MTLSATLGQRASVPEEAGQAKAGFRWPGALVIGLVATVISLVVTFPVILHPASVIYGEPGDSTGTIAVFWWFGYAVQHGKSLFDNTMLGAPFGSGWAQIPFPVLPTLGGTLLTLGFGPTVTWNLWVLSSFPLTAFTAYLAGRRLRMSPLGAAFAALVFAFIPYHQMKATGHMTEAHMELFPALLYFLLRWRHGGSRWNLLGAGSMLGLEVWMDYYYALIMLFLTAVFFVASVLILPTSTLRPQPVPLTSKGHLLRHVGAALLTAAAVLPFLPVAIFFAHRPESGSVSSALGAVTRGVGEIDIYSTRPWEYLMPWSSNPLVPGAVKAFQAAHLHGSNGVEQAQVLGYTVMVLALTALVWFRPRFPVVLALLTMAVGALVALPADFTAFGIRLHGPAFLLNHVVPFIRVYARFGVLVMLGATMLAGLGFTILEEVLRVRKLGFLLALPFLLVAVEFNSQPPTHTATIFPAPDEYTWLKAQPAGILIEYPVVIATPKEEVTSRGYTLYQQVHLHPIFNGSIGGTAADRAAPSLNPYYDPGVSAHLQALGIGYVFVHREAYLDAGYGIPRRVEGLQYVGAFDHGDVDVYIVQQQ